MTNDERAVIAEQYNALQSGRAFFRLQGWSSVTITGRDRQSFLQNFCTNDIKQLSRGGSCEAFFLNVKGKIVGHGLIICRDEELVFVGSPGQGERLIAHLDRYIIREDVQLRDSTNERRFLISAAPIDIAVESVSWNLIGKDAARIFEVTQFKTPLEVSAISERGIQNIGLPGFDAARIENGMPLFGIDFDEDNLPQEVGRDREAISFTKGCYLGQETVARIDALGHVNQRIIGLQFFGGDVPAAAVELFRNGNVVGRVTSVAYSPKLAGPLGLAMVRREANTIGTRLESSVGECEVVALPLP